MPLTTVARSCLDQLGGQDLGVAGLLLDHEEGHKADNHENAENDQKNLFHVQYFAPRCPLISLRKCSQDGSQRVAERQPLRKTHNEAAL